MSDEDGPITLKLTGLSELNEKEYYRIKYEEAKKKMITLRTNESINEFLVANENYIRVLDAYTQGQKLLDEHRFWKRNEELLSQDLHIL